MAELSFSWIHAQHLGRCFHRTVTVRISDRALNVIRSRLIDVSSISAMRLTAGLFADRTSTQGGRSDSAIICLSAARTWCDKRSLDTRFRSSSNEKLVATPKNRNDLDIDLRLYDTLYNAVVIIKLDSPAALCAPARRVDWWNGVSRNTSSTVWTMWFN